MKLTKGNQSVEKTLRIIEIMAASDGPMRLLDIASAVELPESTVLRMVNTLVNMGYAYQEESYMRRYGLTMKFMAVGQQAADHFHFRDVIHPYLTDLSKTLGETCCASREQDGQIYYFDVVVGDSKSALTIRQRVGGSANMHCTGSGKVFLTRYTDDQLDALIAHRGLPAATPHTVTTKDALKREIETCLERGYAIDDEEIEVGMRCLAAPVYDTENRIIAAISVSGPASRMPARRCVNEIAPLLCRTAQRITDMITGKAR
ncbi:MAG: IclR family transcriptional regulator [Clostridia bacterium]|nr:IclR family transcriptional regulator [Clostridia bacterium]